jgi:hypothetical protein
MGKLAMSVVEVMNGRNPEATEGPLMTAVLHHARHLRRSIAHAVSATMIET